MIDYYLHKKCPLMFKGQKEDIRCSGCVWLNKLIPRCLFAVDYPFEVPSKDIENKISSVNKEQQEKLTQPVRRFIL